MSLLDEGLDYPCNDIGRPNVSRVPLLVAARPNGSILLLGVALASDEYSINGAQNQAIFDIDEQGVIAFAHPHIAIGRIDQPKL